MMVTRQLDQRVGVLFFVRHHLLHDCDTVESIQNDGRINAGPTKLHGLLLVGLGKQLPVVRRNFC